MIIKLHKDFEKNFKKLKASEKKKFKERKNLFIKDEFNPTLNNHALKSKYENLIFIGEDNVNVIKPWFLF